MPFLYKFALGKRENNSPILSDGELASIGYHDIFDYPLTASEVIKWTVGKKGLLEISKFSEITEKDGFYFTHGKEGIIYKRILKERISKGKIEIAKKIALFLKHIPSIKGIFLTGALSMKNASENSDIDFLIVTKKRMLWTTRLIALLTLIALGIPTRRFGNKEQKDKLCLNMWLDEVALSWNKKDRNLYTAHEIGQIVPLVNKNHIYEEFIEKNKWIFDYWPNAAREREYRKLVVKHNPSLLFLLFNPIEKIFFKLQHLYMKSKITSEVVTSQKAIFHPNDWGEIVLRRLNS